MKFKKRLAENLKEELTEEELLLLPRGFQTLGNVIILKLNPVLFEKKEVIAKAYLSMLPNIRGVYLNEGRIVGSFREPENIVFIAGVDDPIVDHKEHDVTYRFDITKIMFSKGNVNERKYLATLVNSGEIVVDMFAGIGYFSLPVAKHSDVKRIYSIEANKVSFEYLSENIKRNNLEEKIVPIYGDCKEEVTKLSNSGIKADRVIMGVFPAPKEYIQNALLLSKKEGSIYHYEGVVERENYLSLFNDFHKITERENKVCELKSFRFVKSYGPNLFHTVLDILVEG